jgi:predicted Zn-dependent protease
MRMALAAAAVFMCTAAHAQERSASLIRDAEIEETLRVYEEPLLRAAGLNPSDVSMFIVGDKTPNAFVAGGQQIFVHSGLIMLAQSPNELIGVLAHETGHISGGHLARLREDARISSRPALVAIGLGILAIAIGQHEAGAALIAGAGAFAQGNFVRHTTIHESSADQLALTVLERTGQSGRGLISFFNRELRPYEFMSRAPPYMITHPYSSDRVEALRPRVENAQHADTQDTPENIRRFRFMQAKLTGFVEPRSRTLQVYPPSDRSQPARYARAIADCGCGMETEPPDLPRALAEIKSLIAEGARNPYFHELAGQILFENGRAGEAIAYFRRSVELRPRAALLEINLAHALLESGGRASADEAIRLIQRAVQSEPDNAFAWLVLSQAHDLKGEEGLARLASAEQAFALGDLVRAHVFAERARRTLTQGSASWRRATDIVAIGEQLSD